MFFDDEGKPFRMVGFTADITARKLVEEELRWNEALLAQAQHVSSTGGFFWRPTTGEITWSEEVYRIFEVEASAAITPELIFTRLHPEDHEAFTEVLTRRAAEGGDFVFEHRLLLPDGRVKYLHSVAQATQGENGQLLYVAAVQDVTDRRHSEEALGRARSELARASRVTSLGALAASIAHEVNQPLSGIVTNASTCLRMLAADPPNLEGVRKTVERTIRDGHRASDVIIRLRSLFSNKDVAMETLDLNRLVTEVVALTRMELQRGKVVVKYELSERLPTITGDRIQLQQVILNLVLNAIDSMGKVSERERQMILRTQTETDGNVRLTVQDSGIGLHGSEANRLFEAFYTTKEEGMGIGLSVSRSIIESHNGRIWASANDGPGTSFAISIPSIKTETPSPAFAAERSINFEEPKLRTRKGKL
jgi:PAS domain S-box-containing protein